jgi:hypothetical protein
MGRALGVAFEVEKVFEIAGRGVVFARALEDANFPFTVEATLQGCAVTGFDVPRAVGSDGQVRRDLFAFFLERAGDRGKFSKGQRVKLIP